MRILQKNSRFNVRQRSLPFLWTGSFLCLGLYRSFVFRYNQKHIRGILRDNMDKIIRGGNYYEKKNDGNLFNIVNDSIHALRMWFIYRK